MSVWPFIVSPRLVLYICTFAYLRGQGLHCTGNLLFATNPGISQFLQSFNIYLASDWASRSCKSLEWYMVKSENHISLKTRMYSVSWNRTIFTSTLKYTHTAKYPIVHFSIHCQKRDKGGDGGDQIYVNISPTFVHFIIFIIIFVISFFILIIKKMQRNRTPWSTCVWCPPNVQPDSSSPRWKWQNLSNLNWKLKHQHVWKI